MSISRCAVGSLHPFVAVAFFLATGINFAAETEFIPTIDLSVGRQGNVAFVGEPIPDDYTRIGVDLGVSATTGRTLFVLRYRPSKVFYRKFSELDYTEHQFLTSLNRALSPDIQLLFDVLLYSGQGQGIDPDQPDAPVTLVPRTDLDRGTVRLGTVIASGPRSVWNSGIGVSAVRFDNTFGTNLEDADTFFAGLGYDHSLSARSSLGGAYDFQHFEYEESGSVNVHTLMVVTGYMPGQFTNLRVGLGGFRAESGSESVSDPTGELLVTREVGERSLLGAGVSQLVSVGIGLQQATLDRRGFLGWNFRVARDISATANVAYSYRKDLGSLRDPIQTGIRTFLTSAALTWNPGPGKGLSVYHSFNNQETLGSADSRLDTRFHSFGFTILWSPGAR